MSSPRSAEAAPLGAQDGDRSVGVAVLGSTGSIGRQAIDVLEANPRFRVVALAAGTNADLLVEQAHRLRPAVVAIAAPRRGLPIGDRLPLGTDLEPGDDALVALATRPDVDVVIVGTGGLVSLRPVLAALHAGKVVATANKETLVAGGHLVMPLARALAGERAAIDARDPMASPLGWLRPIDSEHSAIWQCLVGEDLRRVERLILTASGGPFLDLPAAEFAAITPERALRHPTWHMGRKITIDSATLVNKGLEVIEAHWLYDAPYEAIDVVIHPQSIVHSAVRFSDGSLKAQLGSPDMRLPIQYALTHPDRGPAAAAAPDLVEVGSLDFRAPDEARFPALRIAREAGRLGPRATTALISADEVAVGRFLTGEIDFPGIPRLLDAAVTRFGASRQGDPDLAELLELDREVRAFGTAWKAGSRTARRGARR
jgi:1-deoxy-D-xylulose-5-phosphate reductoisomerase